MLLEPSVIVFYVHDIQVSREFYQSLLGILPDKNSPDFCSFKLSSGMSFALKANYNIIPPVDSTQGNGELAFTVGSNKKVDELFALWQSMRVDIILPTQQISFGYTFVAHDPDGNRLRVVSLRSS